MFKHFALTYRKGYYLTNPWKIPGEIWYQFAMRFIPKRRYHIINVSDTLGYGWRDTDARLLHAAFLLLEDFIEKENGLPGLKYQYEYMDKTPEERKHFGDNWKEVYDRNKRIANEVGFLYDWWKNKYLKEVDTYTTWEADEKLEEEATEMICRLAKVRRYLWT